MYLFSKRAGTSAPDHPALHLQDVLFQGIVGATLVVALFCVPQEQILTMILYRDSTVLVKFICAQPQPDYSGAVRPYKTCYIKVL